MNQTMKKYFNIGNLGLFFVFGPFTYLLFTGLTREKLASNKDLIEIKGTYLRHSFKDKTSYKNLSHEYYFWIKNYENTFQIKADYLRVFNKQDFLTNVKNGDYLILTIPKRLKEKLNSEDIIFVTSIEINRLAYLDKNKVLEIEKTLAESHDDYFLAIIYLIVGLFIYFRNRKKLPLTEA